MPDLSAFPGTGLRLRGRPGTAPRCRQHQATARRPRIRRAAACPDHDPACARVPRVSRLIHNPGAAGTMLTALLVVLSSAGCGGDDGTTTTSEATASSTSTTAESPRIDSALTSCTDAATQIGGTAGTKLQGTCAY